MTGLDRVTASPFDSIRRIHEAGDEFWSARDLMLLMGYPTWQHFLPVLERAAAAAANLGQPDLFTVVRENSGGRPREDYQLPRFAAYLVAMNGDPRKTEVAAGQSYFAVKTREAEARPVSLELDVNNKSDLRLILQASQALLISLEESEAKVAELLPKAEVADRLLDADGDMSVGDTAKVLTRAGVKVGETRLFNLLNTKGWIYRGLSDDRWRVYQSAIESGVMSVMPQSHFHPRTGVLVLDPPQPRVTAKGLQCLLTEHGAIEQKAS